MCRLRQKSCNVPEGDWFVRGRTWAEHTEVDYVLLHDGHKIYAACDVATVDKLDPTARCGFRPLRTYECSIQPAAIENAKASEPLSDLKCKDGDGHNVYLYVSKKE